MRLQGKSSSSSLSFKKLRRKIWKFKSTWMNKIKLYRRFKSE